MAPREQKLISALYGRYEGRPILVIGGGPSVTEDLPKIPLDYPACVISANEHGTKQTRFPVDFIVNVDYTYNTGHVMMERHLAQFPQPKINRWSWADYRIPEYKFGGDSGLTGVHVADMLGGWPVIFTGFDRFVAGQAKYFWQQPVAAHPYQGHKPHLLDNLRANLASVVKRLEGACLRPLSGPLTRLWPAWGGPLAELPAYSPAENRRIAYAPVMVQTQRKCFLHPADPIAAGRVLPMTETEAARLEITKAVVRV